MIYITGNTHGDINRFETEQTKKFTSEDYLIISAAVRQALREGVE